MKLIIGISGASGVIYGVRLLEFFRKRDDIETFLVVTKEAENILKLELDKTLDSVYALSDNFYDIADFMAPINSGSFKTDGMVIIPCSMKTLSALANGFSDNILLRAADVTLKEKRRLVLVPRETPISTLQIRNMYKLSKMGVVILPAMPAFYHHPKSIEDLIRYIIGKILNIFNIDHSLFKLWN